MKLIYPAIFTPYNDNGGYDVEVPDLEGCSSGGDTLEEAMENICDEAARYILIHMESGRQIRKASPYEAVKATGKGAFVSLILIDMGASSDAHAEKAVRKNITIPAWLNAYGEARNVNFSRLLQDALLGLTQKSID